MRFAALALPLLLGACLDLSTGTGGGGSSSTGTTGTVGDAGLSVDVTLQGAGCGTDATTGVTLCLAVSLCPNDIIDPEVWPGCGYRLGPAGFDLQCVCDDEVCPIGTPLTCDQIAPLLAQQTQTLVCASAAEGRCVKPTAAASSGATSTCDKACASQCGGENGCLEGCGCVN